MNKSDSIKLCQSFLGKKINRLTIIEILPTRKWKTWATAICECGVKKEYVLAGIVSGNTTSCGCYNKDKNFKHGLNGDPLQTAWSLMKSRCYNPNDPDYPLYGAKGVVVCEEWIDDFKAYHDWAIANGWKKGLQIDKDILSETKPGLLYSPSTCSIVTHSVNQRNRTNNRIIEFNGIKDTAIGWSERLGMNYGTLISRLRLNNGDIVKTFTEPVKHHYHHGYKR